MAQSINQFTKLNQDLDKSVLPKDTYSNARNIDVVTVEGSSMVSITNSKGDISMITLPTTSQVRTLYVTSASANTGLDYVGTVSILVNAYSLITPTLTIVSREDFAQQVSDFLNSDATFISTGYRSTFYNQNIVIHGVTAVANTFTVSMTTTGDALIIEENDYLPTVLQPYIIGWTTIRDNIYLFAASSSSETPVDTAGQIWKYSYNKDTTSSHTLTLIYNNLLNFSRAYPIANPGMVETRYENESVQNIYWTDNYNVLRKLNVADPNAFAVPPNLLGNRTVVDYAVPKLDNVGQTNGSTKKGMYQLSYRYYNVNGVQTKFCNPSNYVHIVEAEETGWYELYDGEITQAVTKKTITWELTGLDTNYDFIEYVVLYKSSPTAVPTIKSVYKTSFDANSSFTFNGFKTTDVDITLEEFTALNNAFEVCGTIAQKNNILFAANVRNKTEDIAYDARAFRYKNVASVVTTYEADVTDNPDSTSDSINPFNKKIDGTELYKFKDDGTTLGGTGVNISYQFVSQNIVADQYTTPTNKPYQNAAPSITLTLNNENYNNPRFGDFKSPNIDNLFKGYKRNEVYRFGIVFYDKAGNPGFVKWIGDIKIPEAYENGVSTFPLIEYVDGKYYTKQIGIEFSVNISVEISQQISGFSIVRCERTQQDKTILAQGILFPVINHGASVLYMGTATSRSFHAGGSEYYSLDYQWFQSPEYLFNPYTHSTGDTLSLVAKATRTYHAEPIALSDQWYSKYYTFSDWVGTGSSQNHTIDDSLSFKRIDNVDALPTIAKNFSGGTEIHNVAEAGGNTKSNGNDVLAFHLTDTINNNDDPNLIIADYIRSNNNQYGGDKFFDRGNSVYISTNHYQQVIETDIDTTYTFDVYGGDTYTHIFNCIRGFKWKPGSALDFGTGVYFPVESSFNTVLRSGQYLNNRGYLNGAAPYNAVDSEEQFLYDKVFSAENNALSFYPKPFNFSIVKDQKYDTRTYASETKYNGELSESWLYFKTNNFIDAESTYGPINSLIRHKDRLLFFQDKAIGQHSVNDRSTVQDENSQAIALGTGGILQRFDYINTSIGTKHKFGITTTDNSIYFFDIQSLKHYKISDGIEPLSDIKGMNAFFKNNIKSNLLLQDNPYLGIGITAGYDNKTNQVYTTFLDNTIVDGIVVDKSFTLGYNEVTGGYTAFYDCKPLAYINDKWNLFKISPAGNTLYLHGAGRHGLYFDVYYPSSISFVVNEFPTDIKTFDNISIQSEVINNGFPDYISDTLGNIMNPNIENETFTQLRCYTDYQNTDWQYIQDPTTGDNVLGKRVERNWNIQIPRNRVLYSSIDIFDEDNLALSAANPTVKIPFAEKLRGRNLTIDLLYVNKPTDDYAINNNKIQLSSVKTIFNPSYR